MSEIYQQLDAPAFDYRLAAAPGLAERCRGPLPDGSVPFLACIGAAQTFGRFVHEPFPARLAAGLGMPCANLGLGGAGPRYWLQPQVQQLLRHARLIVVQVLSGRSAGNSLFDNRAAGRNRGRVVATGEWLRFEQFLDRVLASRDRALLDQVVRETRDDYVATMLELGRALRVPTVLLWFSRRRPAYAIDATSAFGVLNHFPQLIDDTLIERIRPAFRDYVECATAAGLPQRLWPATAAIDGAELGADGVLVNHYYPSPAMHERAAELLLPVCRRLLG